MSNKCDLSTFTTTGIEEPTCYPARKARANQSKRNPLTYTGYHTRRRGDRRLGRAAVVATQGWVSAQRSRIETKVEKQRKRKKAQTNKQNECLPSTRRQSAARECHSQPASRGARGNADAQLRLLLLPPPRRRSSCAFCLCQRSARRRRRRHHRRPKMFRDDRFFLS